VFSGQSINKYIKTNLPHTLILAWVSLGLAMLIGMPLGVFSATHPNSWLDRVTAIISISFITLPSYVIGLFLLLLFAVELRVMPAMGLGEPGDVGDYIKHLILPAIALAIGWVGYLARFVRSSTLEILNETYIRAAMASGLRKSLVQYKYALKGALIPTVAVLGIGIGNLMGGAVFVEIIFSRPGMGSLIYQRDLHPQLSGRSRRRPGGRGPIRAREPARRHHLHLPGPSYPAGQDQRLI
jgi:peptide/nickel transport system permease protein